MCACQDYPGVHQSIYSIYPKWNSLQKRHSLMTHLLLHRIINLFCTRHVAQLLVTDMNNAIVFQTAALIVIGGSKLYYFKNKKLSVTNVLNKIILVVGGIAANIILPGLKHVDR